MKTDEKTARLELRLTPTEKSAWQDEATAEGVGLSELIRQRMNAAPSTTAVADSDAVTAMRAERDEIEDDWFERDQEATDAENALKRLEPLKLTKGAYVDFDSDELRSLVSWLDLRDSDGLPPEPWQLSEWKQAADAAGISFLELLQRAAAFANILLV